MSDTTPNPLHIEFLGHFTLCVGGATTTRFYTHKVAALLARLAYQKNRQFGREELIDLLWPDGDLRAGRVSLRSALTSLRRQLEPPGSPPILIADYTHICLHPDAFTTDIDSFETNLTAARNALPTKRRSGLQAADALYQGELLPGFYEDWVLTERRRLAQLHHGILMELSQDAAQRGDLQAAAQYAHRCVAETPLEEEAHLALITILMETGQRRGAQEQYERLWQIYEAEMGGPPSPQTQRHAAAWNLDAPRPAITLKPEKRRRETRTATKETPVKLEPNLSAAPKEPTAKGGELPLTLTRMFGRQEEIQRLSEIFADPETRLVTLTGTGGVGKTRTAIEAARRFASERNERVVFAALADVAEAERIPERILSFLRIPPITGTPALAQAAEALRPEPTLVLLDNFEHLIPAGVAILVSLLEQVPLLRCLLTSRRRLDIPGEREILLAPLPVPEEADSPEKLAQCPSVQLLADRARLARPDFQITPRNCRAVAALCRELEGLPLSLELAAARAQVMTVGQILDALQRRLEFLVSRKRSVSPRHQSLYAALEWSYELLTPELRQILARLSVFRGGWDSDAAAAVCEMADALPALEELTAASLTQAREEDATDGPHIRFSLLETAREFADKALSDAERQAAQSQRLNYFMNLAETAETQRRGPLQSRWFPTLAREHANIQTALQWAMAAGENDAGLRLAAAVWYYWSESGHRDECRGWLETFLNAAADAAPAVVSVSVSISTQARAAGLYALSNIAQAQGDYDFAETAALESLTIYRNAGDAAKIVTGLNSLATLAYFRQDYAAAATRFEEVIALSRRQDDGAFLGTALLNLATTRTARGEMRLAQTHYEEAIRLREQEGNHMDHLRLLVGLAEVHRCRGFFALAHSCIEKAQAMLDPALPTETTLWCLLTRGQVATAQGQDETAAQYYDEAAALADNLSSPRGKGRALRYKAGLVCAAGNYDEAERLYEEAMRCMEQTQNRQSIFETWISQGHLALRRGQLEQAETLYTQALREWHSRQDSLWLDEMFRGLAEVYSDRRPERAARLLAASAAMRERMGTIPLGRSLSHPTETAQRLQTRLGDAEFTRCWNEGLPLSCEDALRFALSEITVLPAVPRSAAVCAA